MSLQKFQLIIRSVSDIELNGFIIVIAFKLTQSIYVYEENVLDVCET